MSAPPIQTRSPLYEKAERARKQGRHGQALEFFRKALDERPRDLSIHLGYQKLLQSQGKEPQLVEEYTEKLKKHDEPWCYYLLGRVLHDPAREEQLYRRGLAKDPESFELREALAWALRRQVKREAAEKEYVGALRLRPDSLDTHARYMEVVDEIGTTDKLVEVYRRRLESDPQNFRSHLLYAYALVGTDLQRSKQACLQAYAVAPNEIHVLLALGTIHFKTGEVDEAQRYLEKARRIDAYNAQTLWKLGTLLFFLRKDPRGLQLLLEADRLEPAHAGIKAFLAMMYTTLRQYESGERYFREALRLDPSSWLTHSNLAGLFYSKGEYRKSIEYFKKAIDIYDKDASCYRRLALAYRKMQEYDLAREALERAEELKIRSDFAATLSADGFRVLGDEEQKGTQLELLGEALVLEGRIEEATQKYEEALARKPEDFRVLRGLARLRHRSGDDEEALRLYRRLLGVCKKVESYRDAAPGVSLRVAECLYDSGRVVEAISQYRAVQRTGDQVPASEYLDSIIDAIDSAPKDAERFRLDGVRIGEYASEKYCMPKALFAVLRHWSLAADVVALGRDLVGSNDGANLRDVMDYLRRMEGVSGHLFTTRTSRVKALLKQGFPLILVYYVPSDVGFAGHASVIVGFDDRLGIFLLEDSNWFTGLDRIPYARVDGARAIVVGPSDRIRQIEDSLPDRQYHAALTQAAWMFKTRDWDAVRKELTKAIELRGDDPLSYIYLGESYEGQNKLDLAIEAYRKSTQLPGARAAAHYKLGHAYLKAGEGEAARKELRATLDFEPAHIGANRSLCRILLDSDDVDEALPIIDKLIALRPKSAQYHMWRGMALGSRGNTEEAMASLARAVNLGGDPLCYWRLAGLRHREGDMDQAILYLEKYVGVAADPQHAASAKNLLERLRKSRERE